jgi:hypothetical protein
MKAKDGTQLEQYGFVYVWNKGSIRGQVGWLTNQMQYK